MADYYVKSGQASEFVQSNAYVSGNKMVPKRSDAGSNYTIARRWVWECTTPGTSAAAEPTWPASVTQDVTTVTSGTAVFTARRPGYSSGSTANWAFAAIFLDYLSGVGSAGERVFVSNNHAESQGVNAFVYTIVNGVNVLCVDDAVAPPTTLATGATITTTGANNITITGNVPNNEALFYGLKFVCGSGDTGARTMNINGYHESCTFEMASTSSTALMQTSTPSAFKDCWLKFAHASQSFICSAKLMWNGGGVLAGGTAPTRVFQGPRGVIAQNADLSNADGAVSIFYEANGYPSGWAAVARRCKMPSGWSGDVATFSAVSNVATADMMYVDDTSTAAAHKRVSNGGYALHETTLVRSGGATESYKVVTIAGARFPCMGATLPEVQVWNATIGSPITVTMEFLHDSATDLTDKEVVLEVDYPSATTSPIGATARSSPDYMTAASDLTNSAASWTTTGMSNPNPQKVSVSFTPQVAGYLIVRVRVFKASKTLYVCPKPEVA